MPIRFPRREFLVGAGALAAATTASSIPAWASLVPERLYPPMDLSYFDIPISAAPAEIRVGLHQGVCRRHRVARIAAETRNENGGPLKR